MAASSNMIFRVLVVLISLVPALVSAEALVSATRSDVSLGLFKYGLEGELVRAIDEYRTAVNQTGIEPSQERQLLAETARLTQLLKSRGYYQSTIQASFDTDAGKPKYNIELGIRYRIAKVNIRGNYQPANDQWQRLQPNDPLSAVAVLAQQNSLKSYIERQSCYFELSVRHEVVLDDRQQTAEVTFITQAARPATFTWPNFDGTEDISEDFLTRVTGIRIDDCYQREAIDNAVIALFDTGLFSQVRPIVNMDEQGVVQVLFRLEQRKKRTIGASIGYKSELGLGTKARWQHRNLMGSAQSLSLQAQWQAQAQEASVELVIPSFWDRRNRLSWLNTLSHEEQDFEAIGFSSLATLERRASVNDYFEFGLGYSQIDENPDNQWQRFQQIRIPLQYKFNSVKNPLNPKKGLRYSVAVEPVFDIKDNLTPFVKTGLGMQLFTPADENLTLASRVKWDALWYGDELGSSSENIPDSELYAAGGSTSVRGYGYQSIKLPTEDSTDAVGGTQRWLMVNELRLKLNDSWGVVGFWDVGRVAKDLNSADESPWFSGYGLGVRYFTRFAPIRLDVALPYSPRPEDADFLIYVSLGQTF